MGTIIKFNVEFQEGDLVYVRTDVYQLERIVIGYEYIGKTVRYLTKIGEEVSSFMACELSLEGTEPKLSLEVEE